MSAPIRPDASGPGMAILIAVTALLASLPAAATAQTPAAQAPPGDAQQAPAAEAPATQSNPFMFDSDAGMLTFFIKADKAEGFERVMAKLHVALVNSDKPERRQMAEGWKLYKAAEPGPNNTVLYVNFISPVLKGGDYTVSKILAEVYPQEVQDLFVLYRDAFAGLSRAELTLINDFSGPPPAVPAAAPPATDEESPPQR